MKYKKGDRVRLISKPTKYTTAGMKKYPGKVVTISGMGTSIFNTDYYTIEEDDGYRHYFEDTIAGLASEIPFDFGARKDKLEMSCFDDYKEQTCYCFNKGTYDNTLHAKDEGYTILEWSEYRSTEPPKEEQEKTMELKIDDKPLSFTEAMKIRKRLCASMRDVCVNCPLSSDNNDTTESCDDFMLDHPDMAEPILKEWTAEHAAKTNEDKCNEMFLEVFGMQYATAIMHPDWWLQEYVEPFKGKE